MSLEFATLISAVISAGAVLAVPFLQHEVLIRFQTSHRHVNGVWQGWSVYIPIDGYNQGNECIYRIRMELKQRGRHVSMKETLTEIYDLDGRRLENHKAREFSGKGELYNEQYVGLQFREDGGLTTGTMYLALDNWGKQLQGIVAVRNPYIGTPVAVKILMRNDREPVPTWEDLGMGKIKKLAALY